MGSDQFGSIVETIKAKVMGTLKRKGRKKKKEASYTKMDKSSSVKVEIRSMKARRLIDQTLKAADHPGKASIPL